MQRARSLHFIFLAKRELPMQGKRLSIGLRAALAIFAATLFVTSTWAATQEKVLYSFNGAGRATPSRPDLRCRRQSLRHDRRWRHLQPRDGVRVDARSGRGLDGEGAV